MQIEERKSAAILHGHLNRERSLVSTMLCPSDLSDGRIPISPRVVKSSSVGDSRFRPRTATSIARALDTQISGNTDEKYQNCPLKDGFEWKSCVSVSRDAIGVKLISAVTTEAFMFCFTIG